VNVQEVNMKKSEGKATEQTEESKAHIRERKTIKFLPVKLTEDEVRDLGKNLADEMGRLVELETEAKQAANQYKSSMKQIQATTARLSGLVRQGYEQREVGCLEIINYKTNRMVVQRTDTGIVVEDRPLRMDERQLEIPGVTASQSRDPADPNPPVEQHHDFTTPPETAQPGETAGSATAPAAPDVTESEVTAAVALIRDTQRVSTTAIQRKLKIGYNKAARIVEHLESQGYVSAPNETGTREIIVLPDEA
jgi:DNA segregation ATPase FtsK/SpoIIIE-like protein